MRAGLKLFGMTTTPLCTLNRRHTWAVVLLYFLAIDTSRSSSSIGGHFRFTLYWNSDILISIKRLRTWLATHKMSVTHTKMDLWMFPAGCNQQWRYHSAGSIQAILAGWNRGGIQPVIEHICIHTHMFLMKTAWLIPCECYEPTLPSASWLFMLLK